MSTIAKQLANYRLTTAEILSHRPDAPKLLQAYIWQELDLAPHFPELTAFLDFWERELEGPLHSVRVATAKVIMPGRYRAVAGELLLH